MDATGSFSSGDRDSIGGNSTSKHSHCHSENSTNFPEVMSQTLKVLSLEAETACLPSGVRLTALTQVCMPLQSLDQSARADVPDPQGTVA